MDEDTDFIEEQLVILRNLNVNFKKKSQQNLFKNNTR